MMSNNVYKNMNMTQEQKEILKVELCTRLPYEVKGRVYAETTNGEYDISGDMIFFDSPFDVTLVGINSSTEELHVVAIGNEDTVDFIEDQQTLGRPYTIDEFKPYLRPLVSMTDEEKKGLFEAIDKDMHLLESTLDKEPLFRYGNNLYHGNPIHYELDFLISYHFDYQGLIPMGLALEAPEGMYK